jgi:hypothetical protein
VGLVQCGEALVGVYVDYSVKDGIGFHNVAIIDPPSYTNALRPPPTLINPHKTKNGSILHTLEKKPNLSQKFSKTLQLR